MANFVGQRRGKTTLANGKEWCSQTAKVKLVAARQGNFCHGKRQSHGKVNSGQTAIGQTSCGKWQGKNFRRVNVTANFLGQRQR